MTSINLNNWKLTIPTDKDGKKTKGKALDVLQPSAFHSEHFINESYGITFICPVDGATTGGSEYPRCELREMNGPKLAAWNTSTGGTMTSTLQVLEQPLDSAGKPAKMVIGQIHGKSNELIRLYWEDGRVYYVCDKAGDKNKELSFSLLSPQGKEPKIQIGDKFVYEITARSTTLYVRLKSGGVLYIGSMEINAIWDTDELYFKAGVYLGVNKSQGATGQGRVKFTGLDYSHVKGGGFGGWIEDAAPQPPAVAGTLNATDLKDIRNIVRQELLLNK